MHKFNIYLIILFLLQTSDRPLHAFYEMDYSAIRQFIDWIKTDNKEALSKHVQYPLHRTYPIPSVEDAEDFIDRYDEIFDDELVNMIVNSDPEEDWSGVGWRGVMLKSGMVWLDYDGTLRAIHHQSKFEQEKELKLIEKERRRLHPSIRKFEYPIFEWKTKSYIIRVDGMNHLGYRYTSWSIDKKVSDKPDLVLVGGEHHYQGSGGNHNYDFKNGDYIYRIDVNILGKFSYEDYPGYLEVIKSGQRLLIESARARWDDGKYIQSDDFALELYEDR